IMEPPQLLEGLVKAIQDAITSNRRYDDIALPVFDPEKNENGAEGWCRSIEKLGAEFKWTSIQQAATADWPSVLWKVQLSLNTTVQQSTGFSPIRLLIGRNSNIPSIQARLDDVIRDDNAIIDVTADRQLAHQRLKIVADKFKERFDRTRRDNIDYSVGDTVYVNQDHRRHDKLKEKFKGPYEIMNILDNDRFSLRGIGNLRNIIVAKDKIRLWPGEWTEQN
ncbi:hypothetical protein HW555_000457, partial [Spodoptera exigua]